MSEYTFISCDEQLSYVCNYLGLQKIIAVDLEADSMHCFAEKICLIQVATREMGYLIDPFKISDMSPFLDLLENPSITKVFHGSDFDIRSLDRQWGKRIQNLFDTQIACQILNIKKQGLGDLLENFLQVITDKRFQKHNWAIRPLPDEMISYAVTDVIHLIKIHDILIKKLKDKKRLEWMHEECELQTKIRYDNPHIPPLFKRFKGAGKLDGKSLGVLENLLLLRQEIAEKKDLPLYKVISNNSIMELSKAKPTSSAQMVDSKILSKKQIYMYGNACLKAIKDALSLPKDQLPAYPKQPSMPVTPEIKNDIKKLKELRERMSIRLKIDPGFLLNNKTINALCQLKSENTELSACGMKNWQIETFGKDVLATLGKN